MDDETDQAIAAAGPRLRELRQHRELTLDEVSTQTGISRSTLSRLESGGRRASLELLLPLARLYGVTLDELVDAPFTGDPRVTLRATRAGDRTVLPLTRRPGGIQAFKVVLDPSDPRVEPSPRTHTGYEWLYVLDGRLRLVLGDGRRVGGQGEATGNRVGLRDGDLGRTSQGGGCEVG